MPFSFADFLRGRDPFFTPQPTAAPTPSPAPAPTPIATTPTTTTAPGVVTSPTGLPSAVNYQSGFLLSSNKPAPPTDPNSYIGLPTPSPNQTIGFGGAAGGHANVNVPNPSTPFTPSVPSAPSPPTGVTTLPSFPQLPVTDPALAAQVAANTAAITQFNTTINDFSFRDLLRQQINVSVINQAALTPRELQVSQSAKQQYPRLIFGETIVGAQILAITTDDDDLVVACGWCIGEISGVQEVYFNDEVKPASATVTHYTGTSGQLVDATLNAAMPTTPVDFDENYVYTHNGTAIGIAYTVIKVPVADLTGMPRISAKVQGFKTNAGAYSDNAGHALAEFMENATWGMGKTVDGTSRTALVNHCDTLLTGSVERCRIGLAIETRQPNEAIIETLRAIAECWVIDDNDVVKFIIDTTGASSGNYNTDKIIANTLRMWKPDLTASPTVIIVKHTDQQTVPYRERDAVAELSGVSAGTVPYRPVTIRMSGIPTHYQAKIMATQFLNRNTQSDFRAEFVLPPEALDLSLGDIIDFTHPSGPSAKTMRVMGIAQDPAGWRITLHEYASSIYSTTVVNTASPNDSSLPDPNSPPAYTGITQFADFNAVSAWGTEAIWFQITITEAAWPHIAKYRVVVREDDTNKIVEYRDVEPNEFTAGSFQFNTSDVFPYTVHGFNPGGYTCYVRIVSTTNKIGVADTAVETLAAQAPPTPISFAAVERNNGGVHLSWGQFPEELNYRSWRLKRGTISDTWATATTLIDNIYATQYFDPQPTSGAANRFFLRTNDGFGNFTGSDATVDLTPTKSSGPFVANADWSYEDTDVQEASTSNAIPVRDAGGSLNAVVYYADQGNSATDLISTAALAYRRDNGANNAIQFAPVADIRTFLDWTYVDGDVTEASTNSKIPIRNSSGQLLAATLRMHNPHSTVGLSDNDAGVIYRQTATAGTNNALRCAPFSNFITELKSRGLGVASVQHVSLVLIGGAGGNTGSVAITEVNTLTSFNIISWQSHAGNTTFEENECRADFTQNTSTGNNSDQITITRNVNGGTDGQITLRIQVVTID